MVLISMKGLTKLESMSNGRNQSMVEDSELEALDLSSYTIIGGQLFRKERRPYMNIFPREISFSDEARILLNSCQAIKILINEKKRTIAIKGAYPSEGHSLIWSNGNRKKKHIPRYACPKLTSFLYEAWGLDPKYRYKTFGELVQYADKPMVLFDFNNAESFAVKWEDLSNRGPR